MRSRLLEVSAAMVLLLGIPALGAIAGCCNDVTTSTCLDWSRSTTCPSADEAASKLDVARHRVTSGGTFWPAHDYRVDGQHVHEPSTCCYDVTSTICTTELN